MLGNESLGKLTVDLNANTAGLRKGMSQATSILSSGLKGMSSAIGRLKLPLLALGTLIGVGLARSFKNFLSYSRQIAVTENTFKRLNKTAGASFKSIQMAMLDMARSTGVSVQDQMGVLQQFMLTMGDAFNPSNSQRYIQLTLDWATASGKDPVDAAKDIAEAMMGEIPEELAIPVRVAYEEKNPGKLFDDLTKDEKWKLVEAYLQNFAGAAEEASNTVWGAFEKIKTAFTEVLNAIWESGEFAPITDILNGLSDSLFDLAERIRSGDIPGWLQGLQDAFVRIYDALMKIDWTAVFDKIADAFEWLGDKDKNGTSNIEKLLEAFGKLIVFFAAGSLTSTLAGASKGILPILGGLGSALGGLFNIVATILAGGGFEKLAKHFELLANNAKLSPIKPLTESEKALQGFYKSLQGMFSGTGGIGAVISSGFGAASAALGISSAALAVILAGIVVAIVAFVAAWKGNWDGIRDKAKETWDGVTSTFSGMYEKSIKPLVDGFAEGWNKLKGFLAEMGINIPEFGDIFSTVWDTVKTSIGAFFTYVIDTLGFVGKTIGNAIGIIIEAVQLLFTPIEAVINIFKTLFFLFTGQFDKIGPLWKDFAGGIAEHLGKIISYLGNFIGDVIKWAADLFAAWLAPFENIFSGLGEFRDKVRDWGNKVVDTMKEWGNNFVDWIKGFFGIHSPSKLMSDIGGWIGEGLFNGVKAIFEKFGELIDMVKDFFGSVKDNITDFAGKIGDKLGEFKDNVVGWVGDNAKAFGDWVKNGAEGWGNFLGNVGQKASEIKDKLGEHLGNVGTWVADNATKLGEWVSGGASKFGEFIGNFKDKTAELGTKFGEFLGNTGTFIKDNGIKLAEWVKSGAEGYGKYIGKAKDFGVDMGDKFTTFLSSTGTFITDNGLKLGELISSGGKKFGEYVGKVSGFAVDHGKEMGTWIKDTGDKVGDYLGKFKDMPTKIKTAIGDIATAIGSKLKEGVTSVSGLVDALLKAVTDMGSRFWTAGSGLFTAMLDGLKNAWSSISGWLTDRLQDIRDLLPGSDAKKGPLHTLTKAGRGLFSAMQKGARTQFGSFMSDVTGYAGQLRDGVSINGGIGLAAAGAGGVTVNINGGVYASDRDMKKLVTTIDEELGKRR